MTISSIDTTYYSQLPTGDEDDSEKTRTLGQDAFLKLLVAQLQYQDPLNPMEGQEFASQLAQFSSLDQLMGANRSLSGIQKILEANKNENILDYIGKTIKTIDNTLSIQDGKIDSGVYTLESGADVHITITNDRGEIVRSINAGWQGTGEHSLEWNGLDDKGLRLSDGSYAFHIKATDLNGSAVSADSYNLGKVSGITYFNDIPYLIVGKKYVEPEEVTEIRDNNS